ncbi:MAG: hypothetical protein ABI641_00140, partial [Caldimonas sp.]
MRNRKVPWWLGLAAAALVSATLFGCGGGGGSSGPAGPAGIDGAPGAPGPAGSPGTGSAAATTIGSNMLTNANAITANAAVWAALEPTVTITSVTIASPPVVNFTVIDGFGKPVVGLGNTAKPANATVASYPNLAFALAKLVPGA